MKNSKVSVCIPTYNGEIYIKKTMESILDQTYRNIEIIIVDDGSTDKTLEIISTYNDSRIKIIKNEKNLGMVNNWNKCFEYVNGEYILFLFQDDIISKDAVERKVSILDNNSDVVMVCSATSVIDENDNIKLKRRSFKKDIIIDGRKVIRKSFRKKNIFGEPSNIMYRKDICDKIGKFNTELVYTPDWEYSLRVLKYGKMAYIDDVLTYFRISKSSMTRNLLKKQDNIIKDDNIFINSISSFYKDEITKIDIFVHKVMTKLRTIMKIIFVVLFIK